MYLLLCIMRDLEMTTCRPLSYLCPIVLLFSFVCCFFPSYKHTFHLLNDETKRFFLLPHFPPSELINLFH